MAPKRRAASEPELPEPMQKKAAATTSKSTNAVQKKAAATTNKSKTAVPEDKMRPARAKEAMAETGKAAPEATPAGKGKKPNAEKAVPDPTPAGEGKVSVPRKASTASQKRAAFDELQDLYPCLADCVKKIEADHPCGETLKGAFGYMGNEKATFLESKIKAQRFKEMKLQSGREGLMKDVRNMLMSSAD